MPVIGGSTALAACEGSGTASTVSMGLIGYPEMRKYKYDDGLSTGCICGRGNSRSDHTPQPAHDHLRHSYSDIHR